MGKGETVMGTKYKQKASIVMRGFQLLCIASVVTGFIWASSDWLLLTVLVDAPVTPVSVLLMLYGTLGTVLIEAIVRWLNRGEQKDFLPETEGNEKNG